MARILKEIEVNGKKLTALFDTGSTRSYIRERVAPSNRIVLKRPLRVGMGGKRREIKEVCIVEGEIEGLGFYFESCIIEDFGMVNGKELDIIIGATTMEEWEIRLDPKNESLDLSGLRRREFTEFKN
ncbi:MAG: retroviral-like aspartic protease [Deltaproteobacteria bacterium]|nr:retroviral-like aspartic protease [Deltaproteobacteria bacterium]